MQGYTGASVFNCSPPEGIGGWVVEERSFYHTHSLIKTNDSSCCLEPGGGTAGRLVFAGGSPSLPALSILLYKPTAVSTRISPHCATQEKKGDLNVNCSVRCIIKVQKEAIYLEGKNALSKAGKVWIIVASQ